MTNRPEVYAALDGERDYQETRWNANTTASKGLHSVTEFLVFMRDYTEEALHVVSRNPEPEASVAALHIIRKVAAMGVACMEQHGAPRR
jgi:hypothetical protein